jgi:hypothetical protein
LSSTWGKQTLAMVLRLLLLPVVVVVVGGVETK